MVLSVIVTIMMVDKIGRKTLMLFGAGSLAVVYTIEGYFFWLYALICMVGFIVLAFFLPETKGKSLEQIEEQLIG